MKKFFSLILLCALCAACPVACIDPEYDLSKISTDNIAIGDESSQFQVPLLKISVNMNELDNDGGDSIDKIFDEADTWLPEQSLNSDENGIFVLVQRLLTDTEYVEDLLTRLLEEMHSNPEKLDRVIALLEEKYFEEFASILGISEQADFKEAFKTAFNSGNALCKQIETKIKELATIYLTGLNVNMPDLTYSVERIDLSDDVVDMLIENLDAQEVSEPKNTLHMAGTIDNCLPVSITATPTFAPTEVSFTASIEANQENNILPETRLFAEDLQTIVRELTVKIALKIDKYYPGKGFDSGSDESAQPQLTINLHLIKRGALKFDI